MKKIFLGILALLASIFASAEVVDYSTAENFARSFFAGGSVSSLSVRPASYGAVGGNNPAAFYIFNNSKGGWIIVAGDDIASPVLAYSRTGSIETLDIHTSIAAWMRTVESRINKARAEGRTGAMSQKKWNTVAGSLYGGGKLIESALWGQGSPFNDLCPLDEGYRSVSGCVATAMAIVLRHNKYPAHGIGTLDSYTTSSKKIYITGFSIENHYYDWDLMPYQYTSASSSQSRSAVAQLVYDCGVMMNMDYSSTWSGAFSDEMLGNFINHFGYAKSGRYVPHTAVNHEEWLKLIAGEIDNNRLVLYDGVEITGDGGHQFVCDGYDDAGNVHINWGWNGYCNGYFSVSYLGDSDSGVFSLYDNILIGLVPEDGSDYMPNLQFYDANSGISVKDQVNKDKTFNVEIKKLGNFGEADYTGYISVCLVDKDNNIKQTISDSYGIDGLRPFTIANLGTIPCKISIDIKPDDGIMAAYSWNGQTYLIGASNWSNLLGLTRAGVQDIPVINVRDDIKSGENIYFILNPGWVSPTSVEWYYDGKAKKEGYVVAKSGVHTIKAVVSYADDSFFDIVKCQIEVK